MHSEITPAPAQLPGAPPAPLKIGPLTPTGRGIATVGAGALGLVAVRQPRVLDALRVARAVAQDLDTEASLAVRSAVIGICLVSRPPEIDEFASHGRDVLRYGEHVADALIRGRLLAPLPWSDPRVAAAVHALGDLLVGWVLGALQAEAEEVDREVADFARPAETVIVSAGTR